MTGDAIVAELPALLRYARALTGNDIDAEDLVQDTAVRALERAEGFRGESSLATWLHRILHHRFVDETRRRRPGLVDDEVLVAAVEAAWRDDDYTMDAPTVVQRAEDRDRLFDALAHLPAILRSAVVLHDMDGRTSAEVAQIHGIGLPAAKQREDQTQAHNNGICLTGFVWREAPQPGLHGSWLLFGTGSYRFTTGSAQC